MSRTWRSTNDIEILTKLGIIDKGKANRASDDEDFGPMMTASEGETLEESEDEGDVIFDRESLLPNEARGGLIEGRRAFSQFDFRNRKMAQESRKALIFRGILVCAAFFTLGLCLSIVGPTLPDLQSRTNSSSLSSVVSLISANSFGSILGVAFGGSCYGCLNAFCVMAVILVLCAGATLIIPWITTLTGLTFVCFFQGVTLGFIERGGYAMFYAYWKKKYHIIHLFYFSLAFGACISPLVTTPFVFSHLPFLNNSQSNSLSSDAGPNLEESYALPIHSRRKFRSSDQSNYRIKREELGQSLVNNLNNDTGNDSEIVMNTGSKNENHGTVASDLSNATVTTTPLPKKPKISEELTDLSQKKTKEMLDKKAEAEAKAEAEKKKEEEKKTEELPNSENSVPEPELFSNGPSNETDTTGGNSAVHTDFTEKSSVVALNTEEPNPSTSTSTVSTTSSTSTVKSTTTKIADLSSTLFITTKTMTVSTSPASAQSFSFSSVQPSSSTIPAGIMNDAKILLWDVVMTRVNEINRVHFAYLVIATMSMLSTLGFGLMCCCMPCKSFRVPPEKKTDYRFTPRSLCTTRQNLYSMIMTIALAFLVSGMEAAIYNLLTVYVILDHHKDQAKGVLLTTLYWLTLSVSRLIIAMFNRMVNYSRLLMGCFGATLLVTAVLSVFASSWTVVWLCVAALGFTIGPMFPMSYSYLDYSLGFSPWISTIWLVAAQLGRMTVPAVTAAAMESRAAPRDLILSLLVCALLSCVLFIFLLRTVKAASQLMAVDAFTRQIRQANGDVAEYRRMPDETESDFGNVELDDYLFEGDTVHFDRNVKQDTKANDGIFGHYSNGHAISET